MDLHEIIRRVLRNSAIFLGSRLVFGLLNLASSALVVRTLGLGDFGVVVLLQAYVRLLSEGIKFESWQALLTYGTGLFVHERAGFRRLLGLMLGIDILSILVGLSFGLAFLPWAGHIFEWPPEIVNFAPFFLLSLPFITQGTPNGILRLADRVDILAWQHGLNATVRFAGVLLVLALDGSVLGLVLAWFAGSIVSGLLQWAGAFRELARRRMMPRMRFNLIAAGREFPGIWSFLTLCNVTSTLSMIYNSGSTMLLGASLGPAAAATLQIALQIVGAIGKPAAQLGPIIMPEFTRLASSEDWWTFRKLILRQIRMTSLVVCGIGVVMFVGLGPLLAFVYGEELLQHIWLFRILVLGALVQSIFFSFQPAFLSMAEPGTVLAIRVVSVAVYLLLTLALLPSQEVLAVGFGGLASLAVNLGLNLALGHRHLGKRLRSVGEVAQIPSDSASGAGG